ncbi:hypothetical protein [Sphingomonas sp. UYP23]
MTDAANHNSASTGSSHSSPAGMNDKGRAMGQAHEFCAIFPLNPGGAERIQMRLGDYITADAPLLDKVATVHDLRFVLIDGGTRLLFASTYDGDFEQYIKDFATIIPDHIDKELEDCVGFPGVRSPEIWKYLADHQIGSFVFYSAYPNVTVRDVWKGQKVMKAFDQLLDVAQGA